MSVENAKVAAGGANGFSCGGHARWHHLPYGDWDPNSMRDAGDTVHPLSVMAYSSHLLLLLCFLIVIQYTHFTPICVCPHVRTRPRLVTRNSEVLQMLSGIKSRQFLR